MGLITSHLPPFFASLFMKVDLGNFKTDKKVASRIRRIAAGAGVHPKEVMMLLQVHKQFEGMVGKSKGFFGKGAQAKQQQMAAQMQKNPKLIQQRLNQMVGYLSSIFISVVWAFACF